MREETKGVMAMVLACTIWGLSGLYYKLLAHVPPLEVLAHRTLWSLAFFALVLLVQGRLQAVPAALTRSGARSAGLIVLSAFMISTNWFFFIWSVQTGRATEASIGYYIFPLVSVLFGALFFSERLGRAQLLAVGLAALAVVLLTLGLGVAPWVALIISVTFGLYGSAKKVLEAGPVVSVTAEVLVLAPIAVVVLWFAHSGGQGAFATDPATTLLLMGAGPLTAAPLILFSFAARRARMATIGLVQYLNPTLQFLVATVIFAEVFTPWHAMALGLIWVALSIYSVSSLRQARAARRARSSA
jgi:chloramphenicol-sensitive protein RarD